MRLSIQFFCIIFLTFLTGNQVSADETSKVSINTNYPLINDSANGVSVNLPKDSTELDISVTSENIQSVEFSYYTFEDGADDEKILLTDTDSSNGFSCQMPFKQDEGFSRRIEVNITFSDGSKTTVEFSAFKGINIIGNCSTIA